jgi:hypothetical protein
MIQDISKYIKISYFLGQVFYSIMNVEWMKKEPSWMSSIHYDIDDNVGNDVVIVIKIS